MKTRKTNYKVIVSGRSGQISYEIFKTEKGAKSFGAKIAHEAFWGETVEITIIKI